MTHASPAYLSDDTSLAGRQEIATAYFTDLRNRICQSFIDLEQEIGNTPDNKPAGTFTRKNWERPGGGGGTMSLMHGRVFEKVGVNVSTVHGNFTAEFAKKIPGAEENSAFWASGISLVAHMCSPLVPAVHMNLRFIVTSKSWFGGGTDLTPIFVNDQDSDFFHQNLQECCNRHDPTYYPKFKQWCDEYFYLKHRNEARGIGGIFFDYLNSDNWNADLAFVQDTGETFLKTYPELVRRNMTKPWTEEQRHHQLIKRGRYVEFNLLYDRGTMFGLQTGGNTEAILMSMPPVVLWP